MVLEKVGLKAAEVPHKLESQALLGLEVENQAKGKSDEVQGDSTNDGDEAKRFSPIEHGIEVCVKAELRIATDLQLVRDGHEKGSKGSRRSLGTETNSHLYLLGLTARTVR
jgi:hypothetical protein